MDLHTNTMTSGPPRPVPHSLILEQSWPERVRGWFRMLLAEILCFTSGFRAR